MKKLKLALLLAITIMSGSKSFAHGIAVANADGVTIYYNFINDQTELEVTSYNYAGMVVIPESVTYDGNTYPVTSIGDNAFTRCRSLTEVIIPNSVTHIGNQAFWWCSGLTDGTPVAVYDLSGQQVGTATSTGGQATVSTSLTTGTAAIVKMGDNKSVKVAVK